MRWYKHFVAGLMLAVTVRGIEIQSAKNAKPNPGEKFTAVLARNMPQEPPSGMPPLLPTTVSRRSPVFQQRQRFASDSPRRVLLKSSAAAYGMEGNRGRSATAGLDPTRKSGEGGGLLESPRNSPRMRHSPRGLVKRRSKEQLDASVKRKTLLKRPSKESLASTPESLRVRVRSQDSLASAESIARRAQNSPNMQRVPSHGSQISQIAEGEVVADVPAAAYFARNYGMPGHLLAYANGERISYDSVDTGRGKVFQFLVLLSFSLCG